MQCQIAWATHRLLADSKLTAGMQVLAAALETVALLQLTHTQLELLQVEITIDIWHDQLKTLMAHVAQSAWAARCNLLVKVKLTPKDVVLFSFFFFSFLNLQILIAVGTCQRSWPTSFKPAGIRSPVSAQVRLPCWHL